MYKSESDIEPKSTFDGNTTDRWTINFSEATTDYKMSSRKSVATRKKSFISTMLGLDKKSQIKTFGSSVDVKDQIDIDDSPVDTYIPPDPDLPADRVSRKERLKQCCQTTVLIVVVILLCCFLAYLVIDLVKPQTKTDLQESTPGKPDEYDYYDETDTPEVTDKPKVTDRPRRTTKKPEYTCDNIDWCDSITAHTLPEEQQKKCVATTCKRTSTSLPRQIATINNTWVVCDTETDGGNWVIIQRRASGSVSFDQVWKAYADGFGDLCPAGNFWLGLNTVYKYCNKIQDKCELRFDMEFEGVPYGQSLPPYRFPRTRKDHKYYASYHNFYISDETDDYRITIGGYSGNAGDGLTKSGSSDSDIHNIRFSTRDKGTFNAKISCQHNPDSGGWWYNKCTQTNLNGVWARTASSSYNKGVHWWQLTGNNYSVSYSEIKIRRR